jgi:hypothetical protein
MRNCAYSTDAINTSELNATAIAPGHGSAGSDDVAIDIRQSSEGTHIQAVFSIAAFCKRLV